MAGTGWNNGLGHTPPPPLSPPESQKPRAFAILAAAIEFTRWHKFLAGLQDVGAETSHRFEYGTPRIGNIVRRDRLARLHPFRRNRMTRIRILGAAAILSSLLASPAMAQQTYRDHGIRHERNWQTSYNRSEDRNTGSWPGEAGHLDRRAGQGCSS